MARESFMTIHAPVHQCPKCELRFEWRTELDDHCWHDHPEFRHEYPAQPLAETPSEQPAPRVASPQTLRQRIGASSFLGWLRPASEPEQPTHKQPPQS
jgi:hypothetical protein